MSNVKTRSSADFFCLQGFKPIESGDFNLFREYEGPARLIELTATLSVNWAFASSGCYKIVMDYLCSVWFFENGTCFCIQNKRGKYHSLKELVDFLYDLSVRAGLTGLKINFLDEVLLPDFTSVEGYDIHAAYDENLSEYVYRPANLLDLEGKNNQNKRTCINKFSKIDNLSFAELTPENFKYCFAVEERWCETQDCPACEASCGCAKKSLETMEVIFNPIIHHGMLAFMDNLPVAYGIWEKKENGIVFLYFAKSILDNFAIYFYYILVKKYLRDAEYINVGADMGIAGLRHFKGHLSEHEVWKNYFCTYQRNGKL
ncbi:MAG: phosphatidylglycerol lysyltransferase domain-containing protein [Treponema sp.]|jgi:hypothetical protein|nr:phosphatidylglycerol lysyltransferase domain-containing protein [Treponema sp.]